jgi:hypothetical protein
MVPAHLQAPADTTGGPRPGVTHSQGPRLTVHPPLSTRTLGGGGTLALAQMLADVLGLNDRWPRARPRSLITLLDVGMMHEWLRAHSTTPTAQGPPERQGRAGMPHRHGA